ADRDMVPAVKLTNHLASAAMQHGLIMRTSRYGYGNVLKIRPPLILTLAQAEELCDRLGGVFDAEGPALKGAWSDLGDTTPAELLAYSGRGLSRQVHGDSPGGDAQFDIDGVAERAVLDFLRENATEPLAVYTEDGSLVELGRNPRYLLVIDPIDGTRPASAGL